MKKIFLIACISLLGISVFSQDIIEVTDQTLKISGEENLYFGFTSGDEVIFSFNETNGKDLKEIEVLLYPDKTVYSNFKTSGLEKIIKITEEGVYQFRFKQSGLGSRICHISIKRKPSELNLDFNTTVEWIEQIDTTFRINTKNVVIGYEEKQIERTRKLVASIDTTVETIIKRTERVHSSMSSSGNTSWIPFEIPETIYEPNFLTPYKTTEVLSWAYVITTGGSGGSWYKNANNRATANGVAEGLISAGMLSSGYGALAIFAIEGVNLFTSPPDGENVKFEFITSIEGSNYTISSGNSVAAFDKMTRYLSGGYGLRLLNDNFVDAINVDVEIIAVKLITTYRDEHYTETKSIPIKEKQVIKTVSGTEIKRTPVIARS